MKRAITIFLIPIAFFITNCRSNTERVYLTSNISVELPYIFSRTDDPRIGAFTYKGGYNQDKILSAKFEFPGIDTINLEQNEEWMRANVDGFIKPYNGKKISSTENVKNGISQSDFSFEFERDDTSFVSFARLVLIDNVLLIFSYETTMPIENSSIKTKDRFFKSVRIE